jgi:flagellin-like hook-associated protein FlgL
VQGEDKEIAVIREFLLGDIVDVRLTAQQASEAVSMLQTFEAAATDIYNKLVSMEQLAERALKGRYTDEERATMQEALEALAGDMNNIVATTQYDGNKLFSPQGQTISVPINKLRSIHLIAQDLAFSTENVNLAQDPKAALANIKKAVTQTAEYLDNLSDKNQILRDAMAAVECEMTAAVGIKPGDFETQVSKQFAADLAAAIAEDMDVALQTQANVDAHEALTLLRHSPIT